VITQLSNELALTAIVPISSTQKDLDRLERSIIDLLNTFPNGAVYAEIALMKTVFAHIADCHATVMKKLLSMS
jgi:hypothetical protein